ncbi:hypothetical protein NXU97_20245 [Bacteroides xylanisolvens]|nr:hypothetical protein [Bacteroides xylanisolvens]
MRSEKSKKGSKNNKAKRNVQTVEKAPEDSQRKKSSVKKSWKTE